MIQAEHVSKCYGRFIGLVDVSFAIPEGQIVALLGPNGAGKTTLLRLLTGYLSPSEGSVCIAGIDVQRDRLAAAERIGYLPESGPLYPDMTPHELLRFFGEARGLSRANVRDRIQAVVEQCDLGPVLDRPIGKLSKGLRQRVGMAQALLHDPPVLIMDEPTAGLDPNQIRGFRTHVQKLRETKTLLVSTHILQEVEAIADRILMLHNGRLVFDGTPAQLIGHGSVEAAFFHLTRDGAVPEAAATSSPDETGFGPN